MICDDCIHNAICNKKETEDINDQTIFCGRKQTEAKIKISELEELKIRISNKCGYNVCCNVIDDRINELKGEKPC